MSNHPINIALRFLLELAALASLAYWGWTQHTGIGRFLLGIGLPVLAAALWAVFRVPGDPGDAVVAVPGALRLALEGVLLGGSVVLLARAGQPQIALVLGVVILLHYLTSYDRVGWLLGLRHAP